MKNNNLLGEHGRKYIALFRNELDALGNITGIKDGNGNHAWFVLDGWGGSVKSIRLTVVLKEFTRYNLSHSGMVK